MKKKVERFLTAAYILYVEEQNDIVFRPEGVVFVDQLNNFVLHCQDSRHNFLRNTLHKHSFKDLCEGITFQGHHLQLRDLPSQVQLNLDNQIIPFALTISILKQIWMTNPNQYWFLKRSLEE